MTDMQGITLQQLADLYDASPPEVKKWMRDNIHMWIEKPEWRITPVMLFSTFN